LLQDKMILANDGATYRIRPHWLPARNGVRDWSVVDGFVAQARRLNKPYTLLFMATGRDPFEPVGYKFFDSIFYEAYARYGSDPLYVGLHPAGGSAPGDNPATADDEGASEEQHWGRAPWPRKVIDLQKRRLTQAAASHPDKAILWANGLNDTNASMEVIRHGLAVAPGRVIFKHNAMKASTKLTAPQNRLVVEAGKLGAWPGWEMVGVYDGPSPTSRFGGTWGRMLQNVDALTRESRHAVGERYLARYPGDWSKP
jgi:hypothetical protein